MRRRLLRSGFVSVALFLLGCSSWGTYERRPASRGECAVEVLNATGLPLHVSYRPGQVLLGSVEPGGVIGRTFADDACTRTLVVRVAPIEAGVLLEGRPFLEREVEVRPDEIVRVRFP